MDFELADEQHAIVQAVEALLARYAGPARAIELATRDGYDAELETALGESGFLDVARGEGTGPLDAALVVEAAVRAGGVAAVAARALVAPLVMAETLGAAGPASLDGPVVLARAGETTPVRFAAHARAALVDAGDDARWVPLEPAAAEPVRSSFGYPMGRLPDGALAAAAGTSLGPGSGAVLRRWWRTAVAVEAAGTMQACLGVTVDYVRKRRQFGRAIGSFQALQHRLARCHVWVEGSRWLALEAAWRRAPESASAAAAAYATSAISQVFAETHQLSGAMGFTREHDLHVWSMRLQALRLELGGPDAHRRALADACWHPAA